jgi:hypothetical protein
MSIGLTRESIGFSRLGRVQASRKPKEAWQAVRERMQEIGQLRVAVLRYEPLHAVAPAPAARPTDDSERRPANVGRCASADAADLSQFRWPADGWLPFLIGLRARLRYPSDRRGAR